MAWTDYLASLPGWELVLVSFLFFFFITIGGTVTFLILSRYAWPFRVVIAEAIGNQPPKITSRTRAKLVAFGDGGEEVFLIKRPRRLRAGYGKRIGLREILWVIGDDGLWYNTEFTNFNKTLLELGLKPVERDVRLANSSIRKGIDRNYGKISFMDKYGTAIQVGMFLIMVLAFVGFMWFTFDQQKKISATNLETMKISKETIQAIANLRSGGSGIIKEAVT